MWWRFADFGHGISTMAYRIGLVHVLLACACCHAHTPVSPMTALVAPTAVFYGDAPPLGPECLVSGAQVAGVGRAQFCVDVPDADGQKLVVSVDTARPLERVRIGGSVYVRSLSGANASSHASVIGPIIEIKPFQQPCEMCDMCPCIGCAHRCECSCNALCRTRYETHCTHTAGVLRPGTRWFVGVDAPSAFTLRATLVAPLALRAGDRLGPRAIFSAHASQTVRDATASDGASSVDYYYYDPSPHEELSVLVELLRSGSLATWVEVYVRFGEWPTVEVHDAAMRVDSTAQPHATFVLRADRLLNERLCVMVVARGDAWAQYAISTSAAPSARFLAAAAAALVVLAAAILAAVWLWRRGAPPPTLQDAHRLRDWAHSRVRKQATAV